ncbi:hypothetical protein CL614_07535 [archaeon]|nr:hypothetical protein [archaeon]
MAITSSIANFRSNFQGGTRPNRFLVTGGIGSTAIGDSGFLIKATSLPASTNGVIPVPYRGRVLKIPGDRMFAEWAITIIDDADESTDLRGLFTTWSNDVNAHVANTTSDPNMTETMTEWNVSMLSQKDDSPIRTINLHNCWPIEVAAVDLSYDTADSITEFSVNLAYDFWTELDVTDPV